MLRHPAFCTVTCEFLSNPRRIHSGQKDKEKEEYEPLNVVNCCKQPPSSPSPPAPPPALRTSFTYLWLCYQEQRDEGEPPPSHPYLSGTIFNSLARS
jgi:hypothetical protein